MEKSDKNIKRSNNCQLCGVKLTAAQDYQNPCPDCLKNESETLLKRFEMIDREALKLELEIDNTLEEYIEIKDVAEQLGKEWEGYRFEVLGATIGRFSQSFDWQRYTSLIDEVDEGINTKQSKKFVNFLRDLKKNPLQN